MICESVAARGYIHELRALYANGYRYFSGEIIDPHGSPVAIKNRQLCVTPYFGAFIPCHAFVAYFVWGEKAINGSHYVVHIRTDFSDFRHTNLMLVQSHRTGARSEITLAGMCRSPILKANVDGSISRLRRLPTQPHGAVLPLDPPEQADCANRFGYRIIRLGRVGSAMAHRVIWIASNGPIPEGLEINHKNGKKGDNRLDNLELVTPSENTVHSYRLNPDLGKRTKKITAADVVDIRSSTKTREQLAEDYGVDYRTIWGIVKHRTWQHVKQPEPKWPREHPPCECVSFVPKEKP